MTIGERIKRIRLENGMTQKELGNKCGIADSAIRRYELGGANPKMETLKKIAVALNVSFEDLVDIDDEVSIVEPATDELLKEIADLRYSLNNEGLIKTRDYMYDIMGNPKYKIFN